MLRIGVLLAVLCMATLPVRAQIPLCPQTVYDALPNGGNLEVCYWPPPVVGESATDTPTIVPSDTPTAVPTDTPTSTPTPTATLAAIPTRTLAVWTPLPTPVAHNANCAATSIGLIPLTEPGGGGLYSDGSNVPPYMASINAANAQIVPRDANGAPSSAGKVVLLGLGMSNANLEFAQLDQVTRTDAQKDPALTLVNGAQNGWDIVRVNGAEGTTYWATVQSQLAARSVTAAQVQVIWLKQAIINPATYGNYAQYNAALVDQYTTHLQTIATKFPNVKLIYLNSRSYGGYVWDQTTEPEPYAWSSGLAVKDLIGLQQAGDARLSSVPLLLWSWYFWADGTTPRTDGWAWPCSYFASADGLHPSGAGALALAYRIRTFLRTDLTTTWYRP